ncbi:FxsA family protein [Aestuariimicrobium sp. Y1814]|uniref:FxsA family protein n=1 Tax=Aestuariimicrobium sp. Y1814 TaxID=3418742 RepID=UPI003DA7631D
MNQVNAQVRSRWVPLVVLLVIIAIPLLEIWILVQLGASLGLGWTVLLLLGIAALGLALIIFEGRRTWRAFVEAIGRGEVPGREMTDGALVMLGGVLLMFPGIISDVLGLICLIPFTRALPRKLIERWARSRGLVATTVRTSRSGVIPGEVVEDESTAAPERPGDNDSPPALEGRIID